MEMALISFQLLRFSEVAILLGCGWAEFELNVLCNAKPYFDPPKLKSLCGSHPLLPNIGYHCKILGSFVLCFIDTIIHILFNLNTQPPDLVFLTQASQRLLFCPHKELSKSA